MRNYLLRNCWKSQVAISFPRLRSSAGGYAPPAPVGDRDLVQLICALRLVLPDAGFTLSTRESPALRDHLIPLGITTMSAGSHTEPGGYARRERRERRSSRWRMNGPPGAVAEVLRRKGYEPVWKEWDAALAS